MVHSEETLEVLREAVRLSPDNLPLRQHLAETLLAMTRYPDAEREFRHALVLDGTNERIKIGLAEAFFHQGKRSQALVLIEDLVKDSRCSGRVYLLHARLLLDAGEIERAVHQYREAIDLDPSLADEELLHQFGLSTKGDLSSGARRARTNRQDSTNRSEPTSFDRPSITFRDVGGMDTLKEEIRLKIIYPMTHPELYQAYGKPIGGGILLYGPPGCGKTHLARATAGEVKAGFLAVGINDVLDMWIGQSERNLHALFEQARTNQPSVLFFDEVDALGASRTDMRQSGSRHLINQFLAELDGVQASNDGVLILAATNTPWHLDTAFRRPGRFDRILFVPPPDLAARAAILKILCREKPMAEINFELLAQKTDTYSGADLKAVVDLAVEKKLREALRDGIPRPLTTQDLLEAIAQVRPSTQEWFATARNYAVYSNQGGLYDDVRKYLRL